MESLPAERSEKGVVVNDPQYPQDDPVLQTPEIREMLRVLEKTSELEGPDSAFTPE